ncbi:MAG: hypothetical protein A2X28_01445 [Elusimicrobia bacterium GWA2_56_46]|jgi:hypothetical protein|nr:MAG: hypothetical protein A2X28_01445 [Elusimicrobia bacterium GWA2_56_46]OGR53821.1 MAG: hypothetical protein A2X39_06845 [Elusimicrobia bacterium GWC2_56_31]HBB66807.1 hypothetical protein [Elusimicrobiota bacterium]HBW22673.1 hypothetical protein [Elusimicrobiota bacterium]
MIVKVRVIPNCEDNEVVSRIGSVLRVRICASSADLQINSMLRDYLSEFFEVSIKMVNIIRGAKGREKTVEITGKTEEELKNLLDSIP